MKRLVLAVVILLCGVTSFAAHIKGGWIYYKYEGPGQVNPANLRYRITVKVYRDCSNPDPSHPQNDANIGITIFEGNTSTIAQNVTAARIKLYQLAKGTNDPCMTNPPPVCYLILEYETIVELPPNASGYTLTFQRCCRIAGIANLQASSDQWGNTYSTTIPGTSQGANAPENNSAMFAEKDTAIICFNAPFTLDYSATDADGDSLVYYFSAALHGGSQGAPAPSPSSSPPYTSVGYSGAFSPNDPFASGMTINPKTGIITGVGPSTTGEYVISVSVDEYKNGIKKGTTRKELHVIVGNCTLSGAELKPSYITCDGFGFTFQNESTASNITSYLWNFGDPASGANNTSTQPISQHTFTDTGRYVVKLRVANAAGCVDSAQTVMSIFPGFFPNFDVSGACYQSPFQFTDRTNTQYGVVDTWRWDFGETTRTDDTSRVKNPSYLYPAAGTKKIQFIVTNSKGCIDTLERDIVVRENPVLELPFRDTLICSIDTLPLIANGSGTFSWTPTTNMIGSNTNNPSVFPKDTTVYYVTVNDGGCLKTDSIKVNVLDFIAVELGPDTGICRTDTITINTISHALSYVWTPATGLSSTTVKHPRAFPTADVTTYHITANLGKCQDRDSITIRTAPYPIPNAGTDKDICFGDKVQLSGSYTGTSFSWSPINTLMNANTLTPTAAPGITTSYIFTAFSQGICPKPKSDTVIVRVVPPINAFAGNDTTITAGQPLQLNATGSYFYQWTPATGMSNANIFNPIVILDASVDSITYVVRVSDSVGCFDTDDIKVKVFKTGPEIFVPSAFTPNNDRKNDIVKPIVVGMRQLEFFRVYNRWGQMLYSTSAIGQGWDGKFGGVDQPPGTYVYSAQAIDYKGVKVFRKGTIVLIR